MWIKGAELNFEVCADVPVFSDSKLFSVLATRKSKYRLENTRLVIAEQVRNNRLVLVFMEVKWKKDVHFNARTC